MDSNAEHHRPSVHTEQVEQDFVASALLALKQGPSVITLSSSSSWTSLNSSCTAKEHVNDVAVSSTQDVHVPAASTKEATTQESSLPLQSSTAESTTPRPRASIDDQVGKPPIPQQELINAPAQRFLPQQQLREKTTHQLPNNHTTSSRNKGIIQRRWLNMKNINKNMEYKPFVKYHQHKSIIAVPAVRPLHRPPVQVASNPPLLPPAELSFRNIAYKTDYDANGPRRVSIAATATATTTTVASAGSHSRSFNTPPVMMINQTVSNDDDYDHVVSNENSNASVDSTIQHYDTLVPSQTQESGGGSSSTLRNGGPLSQIYNEHRNLTGFYLPIQQLLVSKQPLTAVAAATATTAANTHYDSTTHAPPINKKKPRTTPARLPKHITNYLKEWMNTHIDYPYPSEKEKELLMYDTGIDRKRLDIWLRNNRNRYVKVKRKQQSSHLFH
ncbi:hypothetical protein ACHAWT_010652 [Skeletonema menzelii]